MKQRNFVAKYSQRSGAGKHKEKRMSTIDKEDWVYIEHHNEAVDYLEDKVRVLEGLVANAQDDEVFILSKIIGIRQLGVDNKCWGVVGACDYVIGLHSAMTYVKAKEMHEKGNP